MAQVMVRELDRRVVERLKARARRNGRSLQAELKGVLEQAARTDLVATRALAARIGRRLAGRAYTDSVKLLAKDRAR